MKYFLICFLAIIFSSATVIAQDNNHMESDQAPLPYKQIPDYPESFTPGTVAARVVDGLGFRYYWATEGLRQEDLDYKPSEDGRTTGQTIDHILGLTNGILCATEKRPVSGVEGMEEMTFDQKRKLTLENIAKASEILKGSRQEEMGEFNVVFQRGENRSEFPFWNLLNGQIADAIYHVGQIVSFRRSSGNPMPSGVSVFSGTRRE